MNRFAPVVEPFMAEGEISQYSFGAKKGPTPLLGIGAATLVGAALAVTNPLASGSALRVLLAVGSAVAVAIVIHVTCYRTRTVVVTNKAVHVLAAKPVTYRPTQAMHRLPRETQLGPAKGLCTRIETADERLWVPLRWRAFVDVADRAAPKPQRREGDVIDLTRPDGQAG